MTARQTIVHTTDPHVVMRRQVQAILPTAVASIDRETHLAPGQRHDICPFCGGTKMRKSVQCKRCHADAQHAAKKRARQDGRFSGGRKSGGSRALANDRAYRMAQPPTDEATIQMGHHARGGDVRDHRAPHAATLDDPYVKTKAGRWLLQSVYATHKHEPPVFGVGPTYACVVCGERQKRRVKDE